MKHFDSTWPERVHKSHLGRLWTLFCELDGVGAEYDGVDDDDNLCGGLGEAVLKIVGPHIT